MGLNFSFPIDQHVRELCVYNDGAFAFELRVRGCATRFIAVGQEKCADLRDCDSPREGDYVTATFDVVTGATVDRSIRYSNFGPKVTVYFGGTSWDAGAYISKIEDRDISDNCLGDSCYVIVNNAVRRGVESPDTLCRSRGGRLASISDQAENDLIQELQNRAWGQDQILLGWKADQVNEYAQPTEPSQWLDGTPFEFKNWAPGEPSFSFNSDYYNGGYERSMQMLPNGEWNDFQSTVHAGPFVCEIPQATARQHAPYLN